MQEEQSKKIHEIAEKLRRALAERGIEVIGIYLFGSYARGDSLKRSDIDLIVISDDWKDLQFLKRLDLINEIVWKEKLGNLEVIPVTREEFEKRKSVVLRDASKYWVRVL